jgi:hypothetical protein
LAVKRFRVSASRPLPLLTPIEVNLNLDEEEGDTAREVHHLAMARRNSLTRVVNAVWEKVRRARDIRRAKHASIRSEMVRRS